MANSDYLETCYLGPKKLVILLYLGVMLTLYLISASNDDNFVLERLPTIIARIGVSGYARKLADLAVVFANAMGIAIIIIVTSNKKQNGLRIFQAIRSIISASKVGLNRHQLNKIKQKHHLLVKYCNHFKLFTNFVCALIILSPLLRENLEVSKGLLRSRIRCLWRHNFFPFLIYSFLQNYYCHHWSISILFVTT